MTDSIKVCAWIISMSDGRVYVYCGTETAAKAFADCLLISGDPYTILQVTEGDFQKI